MAYQNPLRTRTATIASGASLSGAVTVDGEAVVAVITPAAWTAAALTFEKSIDGAAFFPVFDVDAELDVVSAVMGTAQARWVVLDPRIYADAKAIRLRSGTSGAPVSQGADRDFTVVTRPI